MKALVGCVSANSMKTVGAVLVLIATLMHLGVACASGISLGATRVIYPEHAKATSLPVANSSPDTRFLVQSWIEDKNGKKTTDFIITPPLFVSKSKSENALRIMYVGKPLPTDRESVYWLSVKSIPEIDTDKTEGKNTLQLAILTRIKIFVRPEKLDSSVNDAPGLLRFKRSGQSLIISNPTPFYINIVKLSVGGAPLANTMVPPKGEVRVENKAARPGPVQFSTINDFGGVTPVQKGVEI